MRAEDPSLGSSLDGRGDFLGFSRSLRPRWGITGHGSGHVCAGLFVVRAPCAPIRIHRLM